jgi:hypothetical protein
MSGFGEAPWYERYLRTLSQTAEQTMYLIRARTIKDTVARKIPMMQPQIGALFHDKAQLHAGKHEGATEKLLI